jgi:putative transposase
MAQSLAKVLVHIVFSTKNRYPFLADDNIRKEMHSYLGGACKGLDCPVIIVGGVEDHVHILCRLTRNYAIAKVIGDIKRESSKWIKTKGRSFTKFSWQNGYGIFSASQSQVDRVRKYISGQEEHHRRKSFQEEYRSFLKHYEVEFDERYLWD